jgi:hypothetical protein
MSTAASARLAELRARFRAEPWLRSHVWLALAFILARVCLAMAGLAMNFDIRWMWLADPGDLREHFWRTLVYFHAYPPGMNVLLGICLALGAAHAASIATLAFAACSLVLAHTLLYLGRALGLSPRPAFGLALAFGLTPPALFFDHLFLYEAPVVCLLALTAALFHRALRQGSFRAWFACFLGAACIGLLRTTFHLSWFVALVLLAALFCPRPRLRTLLAACAGPALLLASLYLKNWAVFGIFDAFSHGPGNLNLVTTRQLPREERLAWIAQGKLSRYAAVDVYEGPRAYLPFFTSPNDPAFPPELSRLERPTVAMPNYNHWFYVKAMPVRSKDALVYLRERPGAYARTVARSFRDFFSPTTRWHPNERSRKVTPHDQHRTLLGRWEALYNALLHGFPFAPVGLYALLPLPLALALGRALSARRSNDATRRERGALSWFLLFQIAYVVAASSVFSSQESSRYRYQIEPFIWLFTATALAAAWHERRRPRSV